MSVFSFIVVTKVSQEALFRGYFQEFELSIVTLMSVLRDLHHFSCKNVKFAVMYKGSYNSVISLKVSICVIGSHASPQILIFSISLVGGFLSVTVCSSVCTFLQHLERNSNNKNSNPVLQTCKFLYIYIAWFNSVILIVTVNVR